ncbi:MAG: hypothetical protein WBG41_12760, partial [Acidimicrobiales bacterium]
LGVAVLGTALSLRYQRLVGPLVTRAPAAAQAAIKGSIGGALAVARRAPTAEGTALAELARRSFVSGMDLALVIGAAVVAVAAVVVLLVLPNKGSDTSPPGRIDGHDRGAPARTPVTGPSSVGEHHPVPSSPS